MRRDQLAPQVYKGLRGAPVRKAPQVQLAQSARRGRRETPAHRVPKERSDRLGLLESSAQWDRKGHKECKARKVIRDQQAAKCGPAIRRFFLCRTL